MSDKQGEGSGGPAPARGSIPLTWMNEHSGEALHSRAAVSNIATPSEADIKRFSNQVANTCTECKSFRYKDGQKEMERQDFLRKVLFEYQWKTTKYFGAPADAMGLCDQDGETLTSPYAPACEHFRLVNIRSRSRGL